MLKKRGDIEVQFNWMYVFIIGAIILLFIVGFVMAQKKSADTTIASKIMTYTKSIIVHSGALSGEAKVVTLADKIELTCDSKSCSENGCGSAGMATPSAKNPLAAATLPIEPVFSPNQISGKNMMIWSQEWIMPYRVTNFQYITSLDMRYVLVGDSALLDDVYKNLPELMTNKEKTEEVGALKNKKNYKVRLIFFEKEVSMPAALAGMAAKDLTAVKIIPNMDSSTGKLEFYVKTGSNFELKKELVYIGRSSLYGAIFSDSADNYECNMKKATNRLNLLNELYKSKITSMKANADSACQDDYTSSISLIPEEIPADLDQIWSGAYQLKLKNDALKIHSCPVIY